MIQNAIQKFVHDGREVNISMTHLPDIDCTNYIFQNPNNEKMVSVVEHHGKPESFNAVNQCGKMLYNGADGSVLLRIISNELFNT